MHKRVLKVLIPCLVALGAGAAVSSALTSGGGVITGCVYTQTNGILPYGALRVIDPSAPTIPDLDYPVNSCTVQESTLTWSQQGPTGPAGPQGTAGAPGAQGPQGPAGADGGSGSGDNAGGDREEYMQFVSGNSGAPVIKGETKITIPGETPQEQGAQPVAIDSFGFSLTRPMTIGSASSGAGAGKVTFQQLQIQRRLDRNSPLLFTMAAEGKAYPTAILSLVQTIRGTRVLVAQWRFSTVAVSQVSFANRTETDSLEYGAVQFKYFPPPDVGGKSSGVPTLGGWNLVKNSPAFATTRRNARRHRHRHHH